MPAHRKPPEKRQRKATADLSVIHGAPSEVPEPPSNVRDLTVSRWREFWQSEIASLIEPSDVDPLRRLFRLYDECDRMWDAIEEMGRVVEGSQGQPRPNPMFRQIESFQAEMRQLEDRFGLSPKSRLNLGITFADAHRSLDGLNERLAAKVAQDDDHWSETS